MKKRSPFLFFAFICLAAIYSCTPDKTVTHANDTPESGSINISVDESFEPVMREEISVYEMSNPGTHINAVYKTEAGCLKDFFRDSATRMIVITRGLTDAEDRYFLDSLGYRVGWNEIATDAVAVIVNKNSPDTVFTLARLRAQLTGKINRDQTIVFDGINQTGTRRFIEDSVLKGEKFDTSVVRAVEKSSDVPVYVASHPNAVGFVGINHIGNPEDTAQVSMLKKVKIVYVQCDACADKPFVLPSQSTIMNRRYPLVRGLYYIIRENYKGLGSGFVAFLKYERGQLIFRRDYLGPIMDFRIRDVKINNQLPPN